MFRLIFLVILLQLLLLLPVGSQQNIPVEAAEYQEIVVTMPTIQETENIDQPLIFIVAIYLTSALFFLTFYFGFSRRGAFLWLSLYCIAHSLKAVFKPEQTFFTADFLTPLQNMDSLYIIVLHGGIFLIGFLLWEMRVPNRWRWLTGFVALAGASFFTIAEPTFLIVLLVTGFTIVAYGIYHQVEGRFWTLIGMMGLALCVCLGQYNLIGFSYFVGIIFFIVCMTLSVGQQVSEQIKLRQAALMRSATLENQLLKKSIQPHFIFNSLASLQELIDQQPEKASDFVDQLADEFRLVTRMSDRPLISMHEELELCKTHLKIMEYRKNAQFSFETQGIHGEEQIPPGIFHTLIENGITHGYGTKRKGYFLLKKEQHNNSTHYTFFNDSELLDGVEMTKGTGLKYIEARLQEAYPNHWQLQSNAIQDGWQVEIIIN